MTAKKERKSKVKKPMLFSALNYKLMGLGVLLVVAGFTAMYLENEVYGILSLYISPVVILAGYLTVMIAILKRGNELSDPQPS